MNGYPNTIKSLINSFKKLPGIGEKSAERMALATLKMDQEVLEAFANSLLAVPIKIKRCSICNHLSEEDLCVVCSDLTRDQQMICVVEEPKNVVLLEKVGSYHGLYHVLDGLISPLDGIDPENINLPKLIDRIKQYSISEVILAVRPNIEGETTALYISKLLEGFNIRVSKIAHGIPLGADMEYIDALTLEMALADRKEINTSE